MVVAVGRGIGQQRAFLEAAVLHQVDDSVGSESGTGSSVDHAFVGGTRLRSTSSQLAYFTERSLGGRASATAFTISAGAASSSCL